VTRIPCNNPRVRKPILLGTALVATLAAASPAIHAQWEKRTNPNVPRLANGNVNLDGPVPKAADGHPDLSGLWNRAPGDGRGGRGRAGAAGAPATPPAPPSPPPPGPPVATFGNLGTNMPDGLPLTPWARDLLKQRDDAKSKDNPDANCMPMGFTQFHQQPQPREIVQLKDKILIIYEANYGLRQIYTDGRTLPKQGDPQSQWYGYSVGRWDGDSLVVETNNLRGAEDGPFDGWLDVRGSPYSREAKFTERFTRPTFGRLAIDVTLEDAKAYTKPFTVRINQQIMADTELIEFICNENQQFRRRIKID
jgi:hypothetical protein